MAKKILMIILYASQLYADSATLAYRCKMVSGAIGYYDHPCEYMADFNAGIFRGQKIIDETIVSLKSHTKNKKLYNNSIYSSTIKHSHLTKLIKTKKPRKTLTSNQLANKRCKNAIAKITVIQELLKNQHNNNQDNEQILAKLQRSLARYKAIKNKYCIDIAD